MLRMMSTTGITAYIFVITTDHNYYDIYSFRILSAHYVTT